MCKMNPLGGYVCCLVALTLWDAAQNPFIRHDDGTKGSIFTQDQLKGMGDDQIQRELDLIIEKSAAWCQQHIKALEMDATRVSIVQERKARGLPVIGLLEV